MANASYFVALDGVTRHGLFMATRAVLQNSLGHAFFPSPSELRGQCDKAMQPYVEARERAYRQERDRYPDAPRREGPLTQVERDRAAALLAKFHESYERDKSGPTAAERAEIRARYGMTEETLASIKDRAPAAE